VPSSRITSRQRRLPRQEIRQRIIEAAADVFAARGYDAATLDDVAAAAGFSKGAVYSNFRDKEDLFLSLMRERIEQRVEAVRALTDAGGTVADQSERAGIELNDLLGSQPDWHLLFIEFWSRAVRDPKLRQELVEQRRPMRALIARFFEGQADRRGIEPPAPADQLAVIVLALSNGLAIEELADPGTVDAELYGTALRLLLAGVEQQDG
jgi:AcrR family transcriptional regulator